MYIITQLSIISVMSLDNVPDLYFVEFMIRKKTVKEPKVRDI